MGGQHSKGNITRSSAGSSIHEEPVILRNSFDAIFGENLLNDPRHKRLLEKYKARRVVGETRKKALQDNTASDSALPLNKVRTETAVIPHKKGISEPNIPKTESKEESAQKGAQKFLSSAIPRPVPIRNSVHRKHPLSNHSNEDKLNLGSEGKSTLSEACFKTTISNATKRQLGENKSNTASQDQNVSVSYTYSPLPHRPRRLLREEVNDMANPVFVSTNHSKPAPTTRKQRSAFTTTFTNNLLPPPAPSRQKSVDEVLQKSPKPVERVKQTTSLGRDWTPGPNSSTGTGRPETTTLIKSAIPQYEKPRNASDETLNDGISSESSKNKLVIRGLRHFVNSRRRSTSSSTADSTTDTATTYPGRPKLWSREFPMKGKFHPDKYIYDFDEGPKRPNRPYSAMAKCKRHGGRCDSCGISTCDLCQTCRKCEIDCECPKNNALPFPNPYTCSADVYSEMFGGDGWKKTCKVLCGLTENEKMHPVGGNGTKGNQTQRSTKRLDPTGRNNMYQSQIDVLNPYKTARDDRPATPAYPYMMPPPPPTYPMCAMPPMYPMPFMPAMMPPMMPFYGGTPFYPSPPPPPPFPPNDSYLPTQNYV